MAFSKNDIEAIKSKLQLSTEIEKKTKIVKKGKDYWCCCLFHEEKTPSCKINDELGWFPVMSFESALETAWKWEKLKK